MVLGVFTLLAVGIILVSFTVPAISAGVTWMQPIEVASGDAYQGPWRMNESRFDYVDDPTVDIDGQGNVGVAWAD